jgi:hypothetical protein
MSILRPWRARAGRSYLGNFFTRGEAERAAARAVGYAIIIDEHSAHRFVRRCGEWQADGIDRHAAAKIEARARTLAGRQPAE